MIGYVVLGTILMDLGILLLLAERWKAVRRPALNRVSAASIGRIGPMLGHIAQVEDEMAGLDRAIDALVSPRVAAGSKPTVPGNVGVGLRPNVPGRVANGAKPTVPGSVEIALAYRSAAAQFAAISVAHLRHSPSPAVARFGALSQDISSDLDDQWDPHADELVALSIALRDLHLSRSNVEALGVTPWETAAEQYVVERRHRAAVARTAAIGHLNAVGDAIRADRERLGPTRSQTAGYLREVNRELRQAVVTRLDAIRPLLETKRRRGAASLRRRDRKMLVQFMASAMRQIKAADKTDVPLPALRMLAALELPSGGGLPPDTAFRAACRAVEAGLRVCVRHSDGVLAAQITHYGTTIDTELDRLHAAITTEAKERRRLHDEAFHAVLEAADGVTFAVARALLIATAPTPDATTPDEHALRPTPSQPASPHPSTSTPEGTRPHPPGRASPRTAATPA